MIEAVLQRDWRGVVAKQVLLEREQNFVEIVNRVVVYISYPSDWFDVKDTVSDWHKAESIAPWGIPFGPIFDSPQCARQAIKSNALGVLVAAEK